MILGLSFGFEAKAILLDKIIAEKKNMMAMQFSFFILAEN